jgi:hypothetical protein
MTSSSFDLARMWTACEDRLSSFEKLADDWDGLGATAPGRELVNTAFKLLSMHRARRFDSPPRRIIASPSGSIVFEWQDANRLRVEAEIAQPDAVEYCRKEWGAEPVFSEVLLGPASVWDDRPWRAPPEPATSAAA